MTTPVDVIESVERWIYLCLDTGITKGTPVKGESNETDTFPFALAASAGTANDFTCMIDLLSLLLLPTSPIALAISSGESDGIAENALMPPPPSGNDLHSYLS
jgi:hypothetical protein